MKISNHTDRLEKRFGTLTAVRMTAEAGFEAIDFSMYTPDGAVFGRGGIALVREMRRIAEGCGVCFNQAHAPFAKYKPQEEAREENRKLFEQTCRSIEIAGELGAERIIVHPAFICPHIDASQRFEMNMEIYSRLLEVARANNVIIAIENMYGRHKDKSSKLIRNVCSHAEEFIRYVDALDTPYITACVDVGHAGLVGESASSMILALDKRVTCIHIHDNDFYEDIHTLPFFGDINFNSVIRALRDIGYTGDVTLEADGFLKDLPDELWSHGLRFMAGVAGYLRDELTKNKI